MNVINDDHSITIHGHTIVFKEKLSEICLFKNCCVIMLDASITPDNNIMAFDSNGDILWNISDIITLSYHEAYIVLHKNTENTIEVVSYSGVQSTIDIKKQCVIKKIITK